MNITRTTTMNNVGGQGEIERIGYKRNKRGGKEMESRQQVKQGQSRAGGEAGRAGGRKSRGRQSREGGDRKEDAGGEGRREERKRELERDAARLRVVIIE
jgi:hypothetical protein